MKANAKTVLVTGSTGMIGNYVVNNLLNEGCCVIGLDRRNAAVKNDNYLHYCINIEDREKLEEIFTKNQIDRVIHLAALAHSAGEKDLSFKKYYLVNVTCAKNIFIAAATRHIPILFISTQDVYGFVKGMATAKTEPMPITKYGKTKYLAELELKKICSEYHCNYAIYRLAPVYTDKIKRDIQKRYYLKYPHWAYLIGKGSEYEFLSVYTAINSFNEWVKSEQVNIIRNIKDEKRVATAACISEERKNGRANHILHFPRWFIVSCYFMLKAITGKNKFTYLLNKAVNPLRTE